MTTQTITIFEVLDNFFGTQIQPIPRRFSKFKITELRKHILEFYKVYQFQDITQNETRLFMGGFLSSPPFSVNGNPYLSSAMLCADSVVLFDPLHYWFSEEKYKFNNSSQGWLDKNTKKFNYKLTIKYLTKVFDWLYQVRPLIEKGIIVLIPAELLIYSSFREMTKSINEIVEFLHPLEILSSQFSPSEITASNSTKGLFTFAGGDKNTQLHKYLRLGIQQFSQDILLANKTRSLYTAPFRWEQHLGKSIFDSYLEHEEKTKVIEGVRNLKLPILTNLTPETLLKIHEESGYVEFRSELISVLQNINAEFGTPNFNNRVAQIEQDILIPKVEAIHKEINTSIFKNATKAIPEGVSTFIQSYGSNLLAGTPPENNLLASLLSSGFSIAENALKKTKKTSIRRIWAKLLPDQFSLPTYFREPLKIKETEGSKWPIDEQPSMNINVSEGIIKLPWIHIE